MVGGGVACECAIGYRIASRSRPLAAPASNACAGVRVRVCVCASVRVRAPQGVCGRVRTRVGARMGAGAGARACVMYM